MEKEVLTMNRKLQVMICQKCSLLGESQGKNPARYIPYSYSRITFKSYRKGYAQDSVLKGDHDFLLLSYYFRIKHRV